MPLVVCDSGAALLLQYITGSGTPGPVTYHLFVNDWVPQHTDTLIDYLECSYDGYLPQVVPPGTWSFSTLPAGGAQGTATALQWVMFTAGPVYGYFVTDASNTELLWSEFLVGGPFNVLANGSLLQITPTLSAQ